VTNYITNLTNWPAISIEHIPSWEANRFTAIQEIPRILWKPKFHYRIHTRPPPVPILSHINLVDSFPSKLLKIHFSNIIPSKTRSSELTFPSGFPAKTLHAPLVSHIRVLCLAYIILLDFLNRILFGEAVWLLRFSLFSHLCSPFTSPLLGRNILLSALISNTPCYGARPSFTLL